MAKVNQSQTKSTESPLTGQQVQCIGQLVTGRRQSLIAAELGIAEETISRWKNEPPFQAALNAAIQESFMAVVGATREAATEALDTVRNLMQNAVGENIRLSAAMQILRLHSAFDAGATSLPTSAGLIAHQQRQAKTTREVEALTLSFGFGADGS